MTQPPPATRSLFPLLLILLLLFVVAAILIPFARRTQPPAGSAAPLIPDFSIPLGKAHEPLPTRIVSFHRGRADKNLIKLAAQLGFNGVQFQLEGSNEQAIVDFASRDAREHLVDYCHSLGMKVTVWVHELSDLPGPWTPEYLGPESADNEKLFSFLTNRYEWILAKALPNVDGLVLTVVETQVRATQTPMLLRLCDLISKKCKEHHKDFILRTFVWHPDELTGVMGAVNQLPHDTVLMAKAVAQDWQMRGVPAPEVAAISQQKRPLLIEFDVEGEYFLHNAVANCMPDLLKKQFDEAVAKGAQGICVRVDRFDDSVLFQPSEVNLWTLGLLASGASDTTDDIWNRWAAYRYPTLSPSDRATLIRLLKPTADVVAELLSVGPFTYGDTRKYPPLPDEDAFNQNWQNWQWDQTYLPAYQQAERGDPQFIKDVTAQKDHAMDLANQSLADLEQLRTALPPMDFAILHTKLLTNKIQLAFRTPMYLAALEYRAMQNTNDPDQHESHLAAIRRHLAELREVITPAYAPPVTIDYLGQLWRVGPPEALDRNAFLFWAYDTENLINGKRYPRRRYGEQHNDPLHP